MPAPRPRHLLLMTLLASGTALTTPGLSSGAARAATPLGDAYPDVGGWGQAWGDEGSPAPAQVPPPPAQLKPTAPLPPDIAPLPSSAPAAARAPAPVPSTAQGPQPLNDGLGQSYPEIGGWGQAWGEDAPAPPAPSRRAAPVDTAPASARGAAPTPPSPTEPSTSPRLRASVAPPAPGADRRATTVILEPEETGDAIGIRRPPRIVTRAIQESSTQKEGDQPPVRMEADQVVYDRTYGIVTAKGKVVMMQSNRTITADTVSYNLKQDVMGASGNVVLTEPTGEVTQADYFELTGDFKTGVASNLRMLLADNSRLTAETAQRVGGDRTDFDYGTYTACEQCKDEPDRTPLWQVNAVRVTHNQAEAQVEYRDAWVELYGVPVLYTPYLSHPDPTVRRKSGFLTPGFGYNSKTGASLSTPYFWALSESEDVTLAPRFMLSEKSGTDITQTSADDLGTRAMQHLLLQGEHRWSGGIGEAKTQASITADQDDGHIRGHLESKGLVELDQTWRAGWQAQYQSDEAYKTYYHIRTDNDRPWLLTRPYVEGFSRRNYAMAEAMSFQGHRLTTDSEKVPVVLPHLSSHLISDSGWGGSYWTMDSDALAYTRTQGTVAQRLSQEAGWHLPLLTPDGQIITLSTSMRADGYHASDMPGATSDATTGRAIPQVAMQWRYPFLQTGTRFSQMIEPMAMVAMSPNSGNDNRIPNEDSLAFELDETNVMRPNRLAGLDRVDGGLRGGYGLRWAGYPARGGQIAAQIAQGWQTHVNSNFGPESGFTQTLSDYLGRVDVIPLGNLRLTDRVRLDKDSLSLRRNEASAGIGPAAFSLSVSYGYLTSSSQTDTQIYPRRHYVAYSATSAISEYWKASATLSEDLGENGGAISWTANTTYSDECFALIASMNRYYTNSPGLLSGYNASLTFVLKSLGEAPVGLF